jgi:hypothetical protein
MEEGRTTRARTGTRKVIGNAPEDLFNILTVNTAPGITRKSHAPRFHGNPLLKAAETARRMISQPILSKNQKHVNSKTANF